MDKTRVIIASTEGVSRALYDDLARQISEAHRVLDEAGVPNNFGTLAGRIDCALRFAEMRGAVWTDEELDGEYNEWLATVDDASYRTQ